MKKLIIRFSTQSPHIILLPCSNNNICSLLSLLHHEMTCYMKVPSIHASCESQGHKEYRTAWSSLFKTKASCLIMLQKFGWNLITDWWWPYLHKLDSMPRWITDTTYSSTECFHGKHCKLHTPDITTGIMHTHTHPTMSDQGETWL